MRAVEGHRENHLLVNRVANIESIKMFVFVHVEFSPNDLLRTCQAPCSCLIPPLDTSKAGANVRDTYSLRGKPMLNGDVARPKRFELLTQIRSLIVSTALTFLDFP